jgi:hypothetical protein
MNNSKTKTADKVVIPLRLDPELYQKVIERVYQRKEDLRGYSINQLLTELIEKEFSLKS